MVLPNVNQLQLFIVNKTEEPLKRLFYNVIYHFTLVLCPNKQKLNIFQIDFCIMAIHSHHQPKVPLQHQRSFSNPFSLGFSFFLNFS